MLKLIFVIHYPNVLFEKYSLVFASYCIYKRRRKHTAHNASLPTILSKCQCHMITSFQNGLDGGTSAASANVSEIKDVIFVVRRYRVYFRTHSVYWTCEFPWISFGAANGCVVYHRASVCVIKSDRWLKSSLEFQVRIIESHNKCTVCLENLINS